MMSQDGMTERDVLYEVVDDRVGVVTLNRPDKANSQTPAMLDELNDVMMAAAADREIRVIVMQANGKHFSAGHDISGEGRREEDAIDLKVEGLAGIYEWETKRYIGYSWPGATSASRRSRTQGQYRRWPVAVLADGHHHRRRQRRVLRSGRAHVSVCRVPRHTWEVGPRKARNGFRQPVHGRGGRSTEWSTTSCRSTTCASSR
jgi:enoyl-CoA hydratase